MGHVRPGNLPRTRNWQQVVGLIEGGAGTAQIANATITANDLTLNTRGFLISVPAAARLRWPLRHRT